MVDGNIKDEIQDKLSLIADPHMGISIVEMGLVRDITVDEAIDRRRESEKQLENK